LKPSRTPTNLSNPSKNSFFELLSGQNARHPAGSRTEAVDPDPARKKLLAAFLKSTDLKFRDLGLLNLSFMHRSVTNESSQKVNNERLEFLGDAILGAVAAKLLYDFPDKREGDLARIKSVVVSEDVLSVVALELGLDSLLILGKGEELSGGRAKKAILADALEALIGAIYLDSGYKSAFAFVSRFVSAEIGRVLENQHHLDYKSLLQEFSQRHYRTYPAYRLVDCSGPEHSHVFFMEVTVNDRVFGPAAGKNKKSAEREAAKLAWEALQEGS
jgi:ribonuclease-3